jgi:hypothetical protein
MTPGATPQGGEQDSMTMIARNQALGAPFGAVRRAVLLAP